MAAWSSVTLCERGDIEAELGSLDAIIQLPDPERQDAIRKAIATTKGLIRDKIMSSLPEIFVSTVGMYTNIQFGDWINQRGYSYAELDTLLDILQNPGELKSAAVAGSIYQLCNRMIVQFKVSYGVSVDLLGDQRDFWAKKWEQRLESAIKRLTFDLSGDGTLQDFERTRTHINFFRS